MRLLPPSVLVLSALAGLALANRPDELKRERLPSDVDFVVHLDLEGLKKTELWRQFSEQSAQSALDISTDEDGVAVHVTRRAHGIDELDEIRTRFGIDPLTDVRAVTLYKVKTEEQPTVVLFATTTKVDEALRLLQAVPGYARLTEGGVELHTWKDAGEADGESVFAYVHTTSTDERVVVLASHRDSALRAAHVLRGEEQNHAQNGSLLTLTPAPGSFMYLAAADVPQLDEFTPASQILGLAQGIQVDLGEAGGFLNAHMGVTTKSPQDALHISNVVQGLVSLASLAGSEAGELVELLSGLRFDARGNEVWVDFRFGVQRLLQIMEALDDEPDAPETK